MIRLTTVLNTCAVDGGPERKGHSKSSPIGRCFSQHSVQWVVTQAIWTWSLGLSNLNDFNHLLEILVLIEGFLKGSRNQPNI